MDGGDFWSEILSEHGQAAAKWIGVGFSAILSFLGLRGWLASIKARQEQLRRERLEKQIQERMELEAKFANKANLSEIEQCHQRIEKHKKNNEAHVATLREAIERVAQEADRQRGYIAKVFDKIDENDKRASDRHIRLLERLGGSNLGDVESPSKVSKPTYMKG